jgi:hypothetical protein
MREEVDVHRVVALDGVVAFDLSTPIEVLGRVRLPNGRAGYQVRVCGVAQEVDAGAFQLRVRPGLSELLKADTVILPGVLDLSRPVPSHSFERFGALPRRERGSLPSARARSFSPQPAFSMVDVQPRTGSRQASSLGVFRRCPSIRTYSLSTRTRS